MRDTVKQILLAIMILAVTLGYMGGEAMSAIVQPGIGDIIEAGKAPAEGKLKAALDRAKKQGWDQYIKSANDEAAVLDGCWFDEDAGYYVGWWFEAYLVLFEGRQFVGQPFRLMDWQLNDVVLPLFGWKKADGYRRYQSAFIEVGKKNGKSPFGAGVGLYMLCGDGEPGAQVYCAATNKEQAGLVFRHAADMAHASPMLSKILKITEFTKNIAHFPSNSFLRAISREGRSKEGLNWHAVIFDELHAQPDDVLWSVLRYGGRSRLQPLMFIITTAGAEQEGIGWEQYSYTKDVLADQVIDIRRFGYICEIDPEKDDWTDPASWRKANPSLGITISEKDMALDCEMAKHMQSEKLKFLRYGLNVWLDNVGRWLDIDNWDACQRVIDWGQYKGRECYGGLDMSLNTDLTAFVLVFPRPDLVLIVTEEGEYVVTPVDEAAQHATGDFTIVHMYDVLPFFWYPEETARKEVKKGNRSYMEWASQGIINLIPGPLVDENIVGRDILRLRDEYDIREIGYDPWRCERLAVELAAHGLEMVEMRQGAKTLSAPLKLLEALVVSHALGHDGNKILRWNAKNVVVTMDPNENYRPDKKKSHERIDGIVATIMGLGRAMVHEEETPIEYREVLAL